jgi:hypothetical protein
MRIADGHGNPLDSVHLALSEEEAVELVHALDTLRSAEEGWHEHVTDAGGQREITVYRDDDRSAAF